MHPILTNYTTWGHSQPAPNSNPSTTVPFYYSISSSPARPAQRADDQSASLGSWQPCASSCAPRALVRWRTRARIRGTRASLASRARLACCGIGPRPSAWASCGSLGGLPGLGTTGTAGHMSCRQKHVYVGFWLRQFGQLWIEASSSWPCLCSLSDLHPLCLSSCVWMGNYKARRSWYLWMWNIFECTIDEERWF
jgi:hypothetical protein